MSEGTGINEIPVPASGRAFAHSAEKQMCSTHICIAAVSTPCASNFSGSTNALLQFKMNLHLEEGWEEEAAMWQVPLAAVLKDRLLQLWERWNKAAFLPLKRFCPLLAAA